MIRLVTTKGVCERLGIFRQTLHRLIRRGEFPRPLAYGNQRRWKEETVDAWIDERDKAAQAREDSPESTTAAA